MNPGAGRIAAWDIALARRLGMFAILAFAYLCYAFAWTTVDVLRPYYMADLGLTRTQASLFYAAQSLGAVAGAIGVADLADRYGRVRVLSAITAGYGLALAAGAGPHLYWLHLVDRFVLGLMVGGVFGTTTAIYVGLFAPSHRGKAAGLLAIMFSVAIVVQGAVGSVVFERDWTIVLLVGGVPALAAAIGILLVVADDRRIFPYGSRGTGRAEPLADRPGFRTLFAPEHRSVTIHLILMSIIAFAGVETFGGWVTTYLRDERGFGAPQVALVVSAQGIAGLFGNALWGVVADRYGRRVNAIGYLGGAILTVAFLALSGDPKIAAAIMFAFSFSVSSGLIWGVMFSELYPPVLRSTAASIFHYGRLLTFLAPTLVKWLAGAIRLGPAMGTASLLYLCGAALWWSLRETLERPGIAAGQSVLVAK